jgi:hypothetical protein
MNKKQKMNSKKNITASIVGFLLHLTLRLFLALLFFFVILIIFIYDDPDAWGIGRLLTFLATIFALIIGLTIESIIIYRKHKKSIKLKYNIVMISGVLLFILFLLVLPLFY